jgi:O-acetyl-ADP-ribose deacetylase (regulator of RNase III)
MIEQIQGNIKAIRRGFVSLLNHLEYWGRITSIALPKIGCGLGGLDWETEVFPILDEVSSTFPSIRMKVYSL